MLVDAPGPALAFAGGGRIVIVVRSGGWHRRCGRGVGLVFYMVGSAFVREPRVLVRSARQSLTFFVDLI